MKIIKKYKILLIGLLLITACSPQKNSNNSNVSNNNSKIDEKKDNFKELSFLEMEKKSNNGESFDLILITKDCKLCDEVLKNYKSDNEFFKLDFSKMKEDEIESFSLKFPNINGFPTVLEFKNGKADIVEIKK